MRGCLQCTIAHISKTIGDIEKRLKKFGFSKENCILRLLPIRWMKLGQRVRMRNSFQHKIAHISSRTLREIIGLIYSGLCGNNTWDIFYGIFT